MEDARDGIVQEALKVIAEESTRVHGEEEIVRKQLARIRGDISRLVGVLKTLGVSALMSVKEGLSRLEQEERRLDERLQEVSKRKDPLDTISSQARQFVETWKNVGQLPDQADAEEQRLILQHYVEVIELRATDGKGKTGTYALRLFPEVRPFTHAEDDSKKVRGPTPDHPGRAPFVNRRRSGSSNRRKSSPSRTRTYNKPVTSTPAFPRGTDYLITQRGAGRSRLAYWMGSSPASLCTFPATNCPSPGLAQDYRHPYVLRVPC